MATRLDFSKLTLMDALDLAALIEVEACNRYQQFADGIGSRGADDAGAVFRDMVVNETKHCDQLAERRMALFGDTPPKVTADDIFDVEAPDYGAPTWNMSVLKAYYVALAAEKKAHAFYDGALRYVTHPEVKALFEELREEEAEHVAMVQALIAALPPSAAEDLEDEDYDPDQPARGSLEM